MKVLLQVLMMIFCTLATAQTWADGKFLPRTWNFSDPSLSSKKFTVPQAGTYRWEITAPNGQVFELSLAEESRLAGQSNNWVPIASNRNLRGGLDSTLDVALQPGKTYLFAILLPSTLTDPVSVRMSKPRFSSLANSLEKTLSVGAEGTSVLVSHGSTTVPFAISSVQAVWASPQTVFLAMASPDGQSVHVWSALSGTQLGHSLHTRNGVLDSFGLTVDVMGTPIVVDSEHGSLGLRTWVWNTLAWVEVATPDVGPPFALVNGLGQPRLVATGNQGLVVLTWQANAWVAASNTGGPQAGSVITATTWNDQIVVASPQNSQEAHNHVWLFNGFWTNTDMPQIDQPSIAWTVADSDTLWVILGDAQSSWRLFQDTSSLGWQALSLPTTAQEWQAYSDGSGLDLLARGPNRLSLYRWDGQQWNAGLDLHSLAPATVSEWGQGVLTQFLAPPSGAKQGLLLVCQPQKDQTVIRLFDLP